MVPAVRRRRWRLDAAGREPPFAVGEHGGDLADGPADRLGGQAADDRAHVRQVAQRAERATAEVEAVAASPRAGVWVSARAQISVRTQRGLAGLRAADDRDVPAGRVQVQPERVAPLVERLVDQRHRDAQACPVPVGSAVGQPAVRVGAQRAEQLVQAGAGSDSGGSQTWWAGVPAPCSASASRSSRLGPVAGAPGGTAARDPGVTGPPSPVAPAPDGGAPGAAGSPGGGRCSRLVVNGSTCQPSGPPARSGVPRTGAATRTARTRTRP